jgi:hypothetical protein
VFGSSRLVPLGDHDRMGRYRGSHAHLDGAGLVGADPDVAELGVAVQD